MKYSRSRIIALIALIWLAILACRTADVFVARGGATPTIAPTRPRPTFTVSAQLVQEEPTNPPPPTIPPPKPPTSRPAPIRIAPTATKPAAPPPAPPTPDPDAGFYYRRVFKGCVAASAPNTRIEGTIIDNGSPRNGVRVRLSFEENGPADTPLADFKTGTDPTDPNHVCPECRGKYRLSPSEGSYADGNWWVYVVDDGGNPLSKSIYVHTQDGPGCNIATIDFVHGG